MRRKKDKVARKRVDGPEATRATRRTHNIYGFKAVKPYFTLPGIL